jgi:hypothetical protein
MSTAQEPAVITMEQTLRMLQIVHGALFVAVFLYFLIMRMIPVEGSAELNSGFVVGCAVVALIDLGIATMLRSRKLRPAFETLQTSPNDPEALAQWRQGSILSGAQAMSVVLFGVVLHFIGAPMWQAVSFFVVGTAAMLLWWPKRP